jgi:hypothetical protein
MSRTPGMAVATTSSIPELARRLATTAQAVVVEMVDRTALAAGHPTGSPSAQQQLVLTPPAGSPSGRARRQPDGAVARFDTAGPRTLGR